MKKTENNTTELRESMVVFFEWFDGIDELPDELRLKIIDGIIEYGRFHRIPDNLDPMCKAMLKLIFPNIDRNQKKYEEKKEMKKAAGSLGGKAKASNQKNAQNAPKPKASKAPAANVADVAEAEISSKTSTSAKCENSTKSNIPDVAETASQHSLNESVVAEPSNNGKGKGNEQGNEKENEKENDENFVVVDDAREKNKKFFEKFFSEPNKAQIESLCMQLHASRDELMHLARDVIAEWELTEAKHADYQDQAKHLISQMRVKNSINHKNNNNYVNKSKSSARNGLSADADFTKKFLQTARPLRTTLKA